MKKLVSRAALSVIALLPFCTIVTVRAVDKANNNIFNKDKDCVNAVHNLSGNYAVLL